MSVEQFEARYNKATAAVEKTRKQYDKAFAFNEKRADRYRSGLPNI